MQAVSSEPRGVARLFGAAAAVAMVLGTPAWAHAQYCGGAPYPPCGGAGGNVDNTNGTCVMSDVNNAAVMTGDMTWGANEPGNVPVYILWYGPWLGAINDITTYVNYLFYDLIDTNLGAIAQAYTGPTGAAAGKFFIGEQGSDPQYQGVQSFNLSDAQVRDEIAWQIQTYGLPVDPNAIYLLLTDNTVTYSGAGGFCQTNCGYNNQASVPADKIGSLAAGAYGSLRYAVVGTSYANPNCGSTSCSWAQAAGQKSLLGPHNMSGGDTNGQVDYELTSIYHELTERMTDPSSYGGGWVNPISNHGDLTQLGDFCQEFSACESNGSRYGSMYSVSTAYGSAYANYHGTYGDYLLQMMRANALPNGTEGYCVNAYGGVFWNQDFGMEGMGWLQADWAPGNYKGTCRTSQPLVGFSINPNSPNNAHAVMCDPTGGGVDSSAFFPSTSEGWQAAGCFNVALSSFDTTCPNGYYVDGISQTESGTLASILCCPGNNIPAQTGCTLQNVDSSNIMSSVTPYDWDYGYYKGECSTGQYMAGVEFGIFPICCTP